MTSTVIVLAAGEGRRMGTAKALLEIDGEPLAVWLARRLMVLGFTATIVVVSEAVATAAGSALEHAGAELVLNREPELGPLHSIKLGLARVPDGVSGVMVLPVDMPAIAVETLLAVFSSVREGCVVIPVEHGRRGHPPLIGRDLFERVRALPLDRGLRGLYPTLQEEQLIELHVNDPGIHLNLNTPADLEQTGLPIRIP